MSRRCAVAYEVHTRGEKRISVDTLQEAESWAGLLGTDYAPARVIERQPRDYAPWTQMELW